MAAAGGAAAPARKKKKKGGAQIMVQGGAQAHNVRVYARFRPENELESKYDTAREFEVLFGDDEQTIHLKQQRAKNTIVERDFRFDRVYGPNATQDYVFQTLAQPVVDDVVRGFNGTCMAYGQTGSGKTYAMFGKGARGEHRGIIPRSAEYLFDSLQESDEIRQVTIKISFMEIYKERVRDLLNPSNKENLKIRETPRGAVRVLGLVEEYVAAPADVMDLIASGMKHRTTSATAMNEVSSRSHALLTITVTQKLQDSSIRVGKLHMADLAGSERASKSMLSGETLKEAKMINQSLSALGNCINALTDKSRTHVPFRDSKLTYLLKDSLGGNTKTSLLVTCSPHVLNADETMSTLLFGQRAAHVRNEVRINRQLSVQELQTLVGHLRKQLAQSRAHVKALKQGTVDGDVDIDADLRELELQQAMLVHHTMPAGSSAGFGTSDYDPLGNSEQQARFLQRRQRGVVSNTLPHRGGAGQGQMGVAAHGHAAMAGDVHSGLGGVAGSGFAPGRVADASDAAESTSLAVQQRLTMKQRLAAAAGRADFGGNGAARAEYVDVSGAAVAGRVGRGTASADGNVVERAKDTLRRIAGGTRGDEEEDGFYGEDEDEEDQDRARQELEEELQAAKLRREELRQAHVQRQQRQRENDERARGEEEEELRRLEDLQRRTHGDGRDPKWRKKQRDMRIQVAQEADLDPQSEEDDVWSEAGSPIPPPPSYPHPEGVDGPTAADLEAMAAAEKARADAAARAPGPMNGDEVRAKASTLRSKQAREERQRRTGLIEFRIDLVPDPDMDSEQDEVVGLGYVEVKSAELRLHEFRRIIEDELEGRIPAGFIFTRKNVPIGTRQEQKRTVRYVASSDDAVAIRADPTRK